MTLDAENGIDPRKGIIMRRIRTLMAFSALFCVPVIAAADPIQWSSAIGGNDHWYGLTPALASFEELKLWAESSTHLGMRGYLVSIHSAEENEFLVETFGGEYHYVLGFTDVAAEGVWRWVSGEPTTYANWRPGEPNNAGNEDYAIFNWRHAGEPPSVPGGFWNDVPGAGGLGIVEYGPTIPEPASLLLFGTGLVGLRVWRKRR